MTQLPNPTLTRTLALAAGAVALLSASPRARAQGCVAAHGAGMPVCSSDPEAANSPWELSVNYRYFKSDKHFTGTHEDEERQEEGSQVINRSNFTDVGISYTFNPQLSASFTIPYVKHDRSQTLRNSKREIIKRYSTQSSGMGDVRGTVDYWIWKPAAEQRGNISFGGGLSLPTGNKDARDTFQVYDNATGKFFAEERTVDQSIQPGTGGYGLLLEFYAYRALNSVVTLYANAAYTVTPEEKNGVPTYRSNPFEAEMSVADSYQARLGAEFAIPSVSGLSLSLGARIEGVPVHDLVGGSKGFRRPGYSIAVEPGVAYSAHGWTGRFYVPVAAYRERQRSIPDLQQTQATSRYSHGDAAFADYLIMTSLSKRF